MKKTTLTATISAMLICLMATGCAANSASDTKLSASENTSYTGLMNSGFNAGSTASAGTSVSVSEIDTSDLFTNRDLEQEADLTDAQTITAASGKTITITEEGIYVINGTASECTIIVDAESTDKVQLVLDGVSITNSDFPAIYVKNADKCFITTTADSENSLSVTGTFRADGDTNTDAVIFSKDDIVLNGSGTLSITCRNGNGISGKDDIKVTGGTYIISCAEDAVEANDSIAVCGGSFTITGAKDGLHAENDDDNTSGWIYISGGEFNITSTSDGIQATTILQIDGGTFSIKSAEGLEATNIVINDGKISIEASDDGINATSKSTALDVLIVINGGEITIVTGQGDTDAIDANGSIVVNGGTINITAPTSSFDYDGTASFNGGTIIINGQQVSSIPQSMMGGGFGGGMGGSFGGRTDGGFGGNGGFGGRGGRFA